MWPISSADMPPCSARVRTLRMPKWAWPGAPSTGSSLSSLEGSTPETPEDAYRSPMRAPIGIGSWCPWPGYLVVRTLAADASDALDLDLAAHRVTERLARRLVLVDRPRLEIHVDHVRLIGEVVEIHPLQHDVVDRRTRFFHERLHVEKRLVRLRGFADHRLGRGQVPRHDDRREHVVAQARGIRQRVAMRQPLDLDARAPLVLHAKCLQLDADALGQRKGRGLARWSIVLVGKELEPARVDEGSKVLRIDEVGDQPDVVGAQAGALDQRRRGCARRSGTAPPDPQVFLPSDG